MRYRKTGDFPAVIFIMSEDLAPKLGWTDLSVVIFRGIILFYFFFLGGGVFLDSLIYCQIPVFISLVVCVVVISMRAQEGDI